MLNFCKSSHFYLYLLLSLFGINFVYSSDVNAMPNQIVQKVKQNSNDERIVEKDNFKFELLGCQRVKNKETISCNLMITNNRQKDSNLLLQNIYQPQSRAFDTSGVEYVAKSSSIGKDTNSSGYARTQLIRGIPTKGSLSFEIPMPVTQLAVVEIGYDEGNGAYGFSGTVQFRNVAISK